jgi:hypothetical protein
MTDAQLVQLMERTTPESLSPSCRNLMQRVTGYILIERNRLGYPPVPFERAEFVGFREAVCEAVKKGEINLTSSESL